MQLVWALVLGILGGTLVDSGSRASTIIGAVLLCAMVGVALHAIMWLRSRVVVSPARVEIVGSFRSRTVMRDELDHFELGTNIQGRPVAVLVLRSGERKQLYSIMGWWGKQHREAVRSAVAEMNEAAGVSLPRPDASSSTRL